MTFTLGCKSVGGKNIHRVARAIEYCLIALGFKARVVDCQRVSRSEISFQYEVNKAFMQEELEKIKAIAVALGMKGITYSVTLMS